MLRASRNPPPAPATGCPARRSQDSALLRSAAARARTASPAGRSRQQTRTMWNRDTPDTAAISSSVIGSARWLSTYQSARWAGFMAFLVRSATMMHGSPQGCLIGVAVPQENNAGTATGNVRAFMATLETSLKPLTRKQEEPRHEDHRCAGTPYPHPL